MISGFIGLGAMGSNMAINLAKAGCLHFVYNRTKGIAEDIGYRYSCCVASSISELAKECDLIILCVSQDQDVLEIINSIESVIKPGTIVVDTSTVSVDTVKQAANILENQQACFFDAPVSGGVEGAKNGTLAMMVGGDKTIFEKLRPLLSPIADNIVYLGENGAGQASKAVNQIMAAGINQAVTEALAFGKSMGLAMDKVIDIISSGAAGNWFLEHRGKSMLANNYSSGFKVNLHYKDLSICEKINKNLNRRPIFIVEKTLLDYKTLIDNGYSDEDISALFRLKDKL